MRRRERYDGDGRAGQQSLFGSEAYTSAGTEEILNTSILKSGQNYQRPVKKRAVDKLIREWDDMLY